MIRSIQNRYALILSCLLMTACSGLNLLPKDAKLYTGATIKLESTDKINTKQIKAIAEPALRPLPNGKFLGTRFKMWKYVSAGENPKSGLKKMFKRTGEAPVLISDVKPVVTAAVIDARLFNSGIFKSYTEYKIVKYKHTANVIYTSHIHKPYIIKALTYAISDDSLSRVIIKDKDKSLIKPGSDYSLETLKIERDRIDALLKNKGYFYFNPDYLLFKADTSAVNRTISLKLTIKDSIPKNALTVYRINNIMIDQNYSLNEDVANGAKDTIKYLDYLFLGN